MVSVRIALLWTLLLPAFAAAQAPDPTPRRPPTSGQQREARAKADSKLPQVSGTGGVILRTDNLPLTTDGARMVAQIDGIPITLDAFEREMRIAVAQQALPTGGAVGHDTARALLAGVVVDNLLRRAVIAREARNRSLVVAESEIDQQLAQSSDWGGWRITLQDQAIRGGLDEDALREEVRERLLVQKLTVRIGQDLPPPTTRQLEELLAYAPPPTTATAEVRLRQIVLRSSYRDTEESRAAARAKAEQLRAEVFGGADFAELARQYSADTETAVAGGDLGFRSAPTLPPELVEPAFRLPVGGVSQIIETSRSLVLLKVEERHPDNLRERYHERARRLAFEEWVRGLLEKARIERYL